MFEFTGFGAIPGIDDIRENFEAAITWGPWEYNKSFIVPVLLDGAARDAGNSDTTVLRPGLLLGQKRSAGNFKVKEWLPAGVVGGANVGDEYIFGVLLWDAKTQQLGVDKDRWFGYAMVGGLVKSDSIIVPGNANAGINGDANEYYVKNLLQPRFMLSGADVMYHEAAGSPVMGGYKAILSKTANYTVVEADNGTLFNNLGAAGAVTFTLPTVANCKGQRYGFFVAADQTVTVASAAANGLIVFNNAAASSIAFSTAAEKLGNFIEVIGISATKWQVIVHLASETCTPTIA